MKQWFVHSEFDSLEEAVAFANKHRLAPGEFMVLNDSDLTYYEVVYYAEEELEK